LQANRSFELANSFALPLALRPVLDFNYTSIFSTTDLTFSSPYFKYFLEAFMFQWNFLTSLYEIHSI